MTGTRIPLDRISPEALRAIIEEFVTRDGTELSEAEVKVQQVSAQLASGRAEIWFDPTSGTCNILAVT
ncbi:MAG: YheU family protein [Planctomycetota bacterium]